MHVNLIGCFLAQNRRTVIEDDEGEKDEEEGQTKELRKNAIRELQTERAKSPKTPIASEQTTVGCMVKYITL